MERKNKNFNLKKNIPATRIVSVSLCKCGKSLVQALCLQKSLLSLKGTEKSYLPKADGDHIRWASAAWLRSQPYFFTLLTLM